MALSITLGAHLALLAWLGVATPRVPLPVRSDNLNVVMVVPAPATPIEPPARMKASAHEPGKHAGAAVRKPRSTDKRTAYADAAPAQYTSHAATSSATSPGSANAGQPGVVDDDWAPANTAPVAAHATKPVTIPADPVNLQHTGKLEVQTTRFNSRWASQGDAMEAFAWRHPGIAATIKYQPPCTKAEIENRSARCVPKQYQGGVDSSRAPTR